MNQQEELRTLNNQELIQQLKSIVVKRQLQLGGSVKTRCINGSITLLTDENGSAINAYINSFSEKKETKTVFLEIDGQILDKINIVSVGFDEERSDLTLPQFLLMSGIHEQDIHILLQRYELNNQSTLTCQQLPLSDLRRLQLVAAIGSPAPIVLLNDPFLPFNGRWQEDFAEFIYDDCISRNRIYIISNLSFLPKSWNNKQAIVSIDVGNLADIATKQSLRAQAIAAENAQKKLEQEILQAKKVESSENTTATQTTLPNVVDAPYGAGTIKLFNFLSDLSEFLRSSAGYIFFISVALVALVAGVMLSQNVGGSREKLFQNSELKDVTSLSEETNSTKNQEQIELNADTDEDSKMQDIESEQIASIQPYSIEKICIMLGITSNKNQKTYTPMYE